MNTKEIRLNKFIGESGFCSRREADKLIEEGKVTINGKIAEVGSKVTKEDDVRIDNKPIKNKNRFVYIAFNKPVSIVSTTEHKVKNNIVDYINYKERIFPIGRLDKDSEGLIFLTNDGDIVNKILRAGNNHEKEYIVKVDKPITGDFIEGMKNGVPILNTVTKKCFVKKESKYVFRIILTQGLNRQIRRMSEYFGYNVVSLKRIRIMNVHLGDLKPGTWRYLTDKELKKIKELITDSVKTEEGSRLS